MNRESITTRAAVAGAATALAAGALIGLGSGAADAATGTTGYTCNTPYSPQPMPISVSVAADLSGLTSTSAGSAVPAEQLPVDVTVSLPESVIDGYKANGINQVGLSGSDLALPFGDAAVPLLGVVAPKVAVPDTGALTFDMDAANGAFKLPGAGPQGLAMPADFSITIDTNLIGLPFACTADGDPAPITSLDVTKQTPTLTAAKPTVKVKKGKVARLGVTVAGGVVPTGTVLATERGKTIGSGKLKNGRTTISIRGLKPGKHKVVLSYAGDKNSDASNTATVRVIVTK